MTDDAENFRRALIIRQASLDAHKAMRAKLEGLDDLEGIDAHLYVTAIADFLIISAMTSCDRDKGHVYFANQAAEMLGKATGMALNIVSNPQQPETLQ